MLEYVFNVMNIKNKKENSLFNHIYTYTYLYFIAFKTEALLKSNERRSPGFEFEGIEVSSKAPAPRQKA